MPISSCSLHPYPPRPVIILSGVWILFPDVSNSYSCSFLINSVFWLLSLSNCWVQNHPQILFILVTILWIRIGTGLTWAPTCVVWNHLQVSWAFAGCQLGQPARCQGWEESWTTCLLSSSRLAWACSYGSDRVPSRKVKMCEASWTLKAGWHKPSSAVFSLPNQVRKPS